jgi:hypothetical protein
MIGAPLFISLWISLRHSLDNSLQIEQSSSMALRNSVERLVAMGSMPGDTVEVGEDVFATWTRGLDELEGPLTDDEGPRSCHAFRPMTAPCTDWRGLCSMPSRPHPTDQR